jgi:hypothetical protein
MPLPYPPCPVPDEINPLHNGGGELGPLFMSVAGGYGCAACLIILQDPQVGPLPWPPGDGKSDFC